MFKFYSQNEVSDFSKDPGLVWDGQKFVSLGSHFLVSFQSTQLQANMGRLKDEWGEFLKEQQRLKDQVDEEHNKAVGELSAKYTKMQNDLTKFPPF